MAQGGEGRAVPVKWAQEKDQPPTVECSERRKKEEGGQEEQGGVKTQQTSMLERWDAQKPKKTCSFFN